MNNIKTDFYICATAPPDAGLESSHLDLLQDLAEVSLLRETRGRLQSLHDAVYTQQAQEDRLEIHLLDAS